MACSHACFLSLLLIYFPASITAGYRQLGDDDVECVNRILYNNIGVNSSKESPKPVDTCLNQHFPELCDRKPVTNEYWILYITGCTVTLHSTTTELKQVISLDKCQTIYKCWLLFDNTSVCLYLSSHNIKPTGKRLHLDVLYTQQGYWTKSKYSRRVFTFRARIGTISSSVALLGTVDDEKGRIGEFFIGNDKILWTVRLLLDSLSSQPEIRRYLQICKKGRVTQVSQAGRNNVVVFCENQIMLINLEVRRSFDITPPELSDISLYSAKSFFSKSGETVFVTITSKGITTNCFIFLSILHPSSHCKVVSDNNAVTDGVFIDENFFSLVNHATIGIMNATFAPLYGTTIADVCPTNKCYLCQTEKLLYVYGHSNTIVLDKRTYKTLTVQNASVYEVLPKVEKAYYNCSNLMVLSIPTNTINIPISLTTMGSGSQPFVLNNTDVKIIATPSSTSTRNSTQNVTSSTATIIYSNTTAISYMIVTSTINTQSPLSIQVATVDVQKSASPAAEVTAKDDEAKIIFIVVLVTIPTVGFLLILLMVVFCCHRSVKNQYFLSTQEQQMSLEVPLVPVLVKSPVSQWRKPHIVKQ